MKPLPSRSWEAAWASLAMLGVTRGPAAPDAQPSSWGARTAEHGGVSAAGSQRASGSLCAHQPGRHCPSAAGRPQSIQNQDNVALTYKSLPGHFYGKMSSVFFFPWVPVQEQQNTVVLLQAPRKITEPRRSTRQLPGPASAGHTVTPPGSSLTAAGDPGAKKREMYELLFPLLMALPTPP